MKLQVKGERDKQLSYAFIGLSSLVFLLGAGNVLTGSLAWYFATTQKTITTPMSYNQPFASDSSGADASGMTMFATSFIYWRLNVSPENIDNNQKMLLGFVPSTERDLLKKALDVEAERIKKGGITTRFDTREVRVMAEPGVVEFSGTLKSSTTNGAITTPLADQEKRYRLKIRYENGQVNLLDFSELQPVTTTN
ncbi:MULTISPECIES: type IV conjugative transfer system protein TraE [Enterobacteriaceae]|jgi:conjugal transfer pilus assembly protein TraE|uniref:IncF plasmid conjugative transfer pilus assembly protein TraE n=3 Tax=Leclercia TaxID=83654 RepID=A0A6H0A3S4_9ENTR|nr:MULTISPECIES: type IV conjugative transfer system protein TraE [Enterobacteriaceae]ELW9465970.1 type IV conjugative transfer system protein TraE [Enterobacter hormaechei]MCU6676677.1 type IV conjugative transfer system protein TraE [Leclercia tamurae]MCW4705982.1 type IV conjugative transfer system protein TraE [Enterobacter kobei]MCW4775293.1 type IV conjugative transfer system protein TraE [Enterobacter hormaechei subsp. hoffmannii]MCW4780070.1 type IV conjugative transfer system protein 